MTFPTDEVRRLAAFRLALGASEDPADALARAALDLMRCDRELDRGVVREFETQRVKLRRTDDGSVRVVVEPVSPSNWPT